MRTSSTFILQFLIDFGLAYISTLVEDKAVDLYVLERAFSSTHPASKSLFASVLRGYEIETGKEWKAISRRLDDGMYSEYISPTITTYPDSCSVVRLRGRKRSMVG